MQCLQLLPTRIVGSIFFNEIINADRYCSIILTPFLNDLRADEQRDAFFQQDGATPHTARQSMTMLHQVFGERLISKGLWPPRSPDLTPLDFFYVGCGKSLRVCKKSFKHPSVGDRNIQLHHIDFTRNSQCCVSKHVSTN